jgi:hypothetical protein
MVERLPSKEKVAGSSPVTRSFGPVAQLARAPLWHGGGYGFESRPVHLKGP